MVFHEPLSPRPRRGRGKSSLGTQGLFLWGNLESGEAGLGSLGLWARIDRCNPNCSALPGPDSRRRGAELREEQELFLFPPLLFAQTLPRKRFLGPALLAGLHIEAVLLDFLNDVFLLHFALEAAQRIFQRLAFLDNDFSHESFTPNPVGIGSFLDRPQCSQRGSAVSYGHRPLSLSHGSCWLVTFPNPREHSYSVVFENTFDEVAGHLLINSPRQVKQSFVRRAGLAGGKPILCIVDTPLTTW
jgi:hypothetical protein